MSIIKHTFQHGLSDLTIIRNLYQTRKTGFSKKESSPFLWKNIKKERKGRKRVSIIKHTFQHGLSDLTIVRNLYQTRKTGFSKKGSSAFLWKNIKKERKGRKRVSIIKHTFQHGLSDLTIIRNLYQTRKTGFSKKESSAFLWKNIKKGRKKGKEDVNNYTHFRTQKITNLTIIRNPHGARKKIFSKKEREIHSRTWMSIRRVRPSPTKTEPATRFILRFAAWLGVGARETPSSSCDEGGKTHIP